MPDWLGNGVSLVAGALLAIAGGWVQIHSRSMNDAEVATVMALASAAMGRPRRFSVTPQILRRARPDGWWNLGALTIPDERQAW